MYDDAVRHAMGEDKVDERVVQEPRKTLGIGVICDTRESIPPPPKEDEHFQQELMALFMILPDLVVTHLQSKATEQGRSLYDLVEVYLQVSADCALLMTSINHH